MIMEKHLIFFMNLISFLKEILIFVLIDSYFFYRYPTSFHYILTYKVRIKLLKIILQ